VGDSYGTASSSSFCPRLRPGKDEVRSSGRPIPRSGKARVTSPSPSPSAGGNSRVPRPSESSRSGAGRLDQRETQFIRLLAEGLLYKEIKERMKISTGILRKLQRRAYHKLGAQNRTEAVNRWQELSGKAISGGR